MPGLWPDPVKTHDPVTYFQLSFPLQLYLVLPVVRETVDHIRSTTINMHSDETRAVTLRLWAAIALIGNARTRRTVLQCPSGNKTNISAFIDGTEMTLGPLRHYSCVTSRMWWGNYSSLAREWTTVWVKKSPPPPRGFLTLFPKRLEFLINFLHTYYMFLSMLDYKFLFKYLQLWCRYAILSATTSKRFGRWWTFWAYDVNSVVALNMAELHQSCR